jgi:chromosome segregation ATPase
MKMKVMTLLSAMLFAAATSGAQAQTTAPAKPAAKAVASKPAVAKPAAAGASAAEGKTAVMGTGKGNSGPILTRDELRVCLAQEETIRTRLEAHTALRTPLDKEKADLAAAQQTLRTERAPLEDMKKQAEVLSEKFKEYAARVKAYELRVTAFNTENPTGAKGERERTALGKDRTALDAERPLLEAEKTEFAAKSEVTVRDYNAKASAVDAQVVAWNQRNEKWNQDARALEAERSEWVGNCADRRYREDDEIAIKRGK